MEQRDQICESFHFGNTVLLIFRSGSTDVCFRSKLYHFFHRNGYIWDRNVRLCWVVGSQISKLQCCKLLTTFFLSKEIRLKTDDIFEKYHRLFDKNKLLQNLKLLELYLKFFPKLFSIRNYDKKSKLFSRPRRTEVRSQNFRTQLVLSKLWRLKFSEWKICLLT